MTHTELPPVAVSCGDPAGIGPEIALDAWKELKGKVPFFLICDPGHFPAGASLSLIDRPSKAAAASEDGLPVLPHAFRMPVDPGHPSPDNSIGVVEVIRRAVELTQSGQASAICTAPISKKMLVEHSTWTRPLFDGLFGTVIVSLPSLGVLSATRNPNVCPPSFDTEMSTALHEIGKSVVPATFHVTVCWDPPGHATTEFCDVTSNGEPVSNT